jgi:hypothetical protein
MAARPDVDGVAFQAPPHRDVGRHVELLVTLVQVLLHEIEAVGPLHALPHRGAGAVRAEKTVTPPMRELAGAQILEGYRRLVEEHLHAPVLEVADQRGLLERQREQDTVELVPRHRVDGLPPVAIGLVLHRAVDGVNHAAIARHRDRPHQVAGSHAVEGGEAPLADRQIDRLAQRRPGGAGVGITIEKVDLVSQPGQIDGQQ